jgi:hypothetical protein
MPRRQVDEPPPTTIEDIADQFLACRDFGHAWRPHDVKIDRRQHEIHRIFYCLHECGTQRTQVLSSDGYIVRNFYTYPDGYVLQGLGRLNASDRARIRVMGTSYLKSHGL